jgi:hypothetical protein
MYSVKRFFLWFIFSFVVVSQGALAAGFSLDSHKVFITPEGALYVQFQDRKAQVAAAGLKCAGFPLPVGCKPNDIATARQQFDLLNASLTGDFFVIPRGGSFTLINMPCNLASTRSAASCASIVKAILGKLGISTVYAPAPYRAVIGDVNGDGSNDMLLWPMYSAPHPESFVILSTVKTWSTLNQTLTDSVFGVALSKVQLVEFADVNADGKADLIVKPYGSRSRLVALADIAGTYSNSSIHIPIDTPHPTEYDDCSFAAVAPDPLHPLNIAYDKNCTTGFVPPPPIGHAQVATFVGDNNLSFCPTLLDIQQNAANVSRVLLDLAQRMLALANTITINPTTSLFQNAYQLAQTTALLKLGFYQGKLREVAVVENAVLFAQSDLDICLLSGSVCDTSYQAVDLLQQQLTAAKNTANTALAEYMIADDAERVARLALAQYQTKILANDPEYLKLLAEYEATKNVDLHRYRELSALPGATVRIAYTLDLVQQLVGYQNANPTTPSQWEFLPVKSSVMLTNMGGVPGLDVPPVLWIQSPSSYFDFSIFPNGSGTIPPLAIPGGSYAPLNLPNNSYVDMGLSLLVACKYAPQGSTSATPVNYNDLTALVPVNLQYSYDVEVQRGYVVKYNLYNLIQKLLNQPLSEQIVNALINGQTAADLASNMALHSLTNTDLSYLISSRDESDWFSISFDANSSAYSYTLAEQEEIRMDVKADLVRKALSKIAIPFREQAIYQASQTTYNPAHSPAVLDACWIRFGSLCRLNNYQLNPSLTALENFRLENDIWQVEKVSGSRLMERNAGSTFVSP